MSSNASDVTRRSRPSGYQRQAGPKANSEFSGPGQGKPVKYGPFSSKNSLIIAIVSAVAFVGILLGIILFASGGSEPTGTITDVPLNDSYWTTQKLQCGRPKVSPDLVATRIVGGTEAKPHSWPWQISLVNYRSSAGFQQFRHLCGGTLIGPNYVITAVHCFLNSKRNALISDPSKFRVIVGGHDKALVTRGAAFTKILTIHLHPQNNLATFAATRTPPVNDIAVVRLQHAYDPSQNTPAVAFACLPPINSRPPVGKRCWASGWGKTLNTGYDKVLKQIPQPIVSESSCNTFYKNQISYDKHLCVREKNLGTCQGDSGGPLVCQNQNNRWVLYGATSFGPKTCVTAPGVFATIPGYLNWICCTINDRSTPPCDRVQC